MAKFSTGLRTGMLNGAGFKEQLDGGRIRIFSVASPSDIPATADGAEAGTLLMELTAGGDGTTGLTFELPAGGVISKAAGEVWMTSSIDAAGKCAYFRFVGGADTEGDSATDPRIQGACGIAGTDMVLTNLDVVAGVPWTLNFFNVTLPTA